MESKKKLNSAGLEDKYEFEISYIVRLLKKKKRKETNNTGSFSPNLKLKAIEWNCGYQGPEVVRINLILTFIPQWHKLPC